MKTVTKWARINGTYLALTSDNVLVGYLLDVKPIIRPPKDSIQRQLEGLR